MKMGNTTLVFLVLLGLPLVACWDLPEAALAPDANRPRGTPEVAAADAWSEAYARFLADYPEALTLIEETEHVRNWDAEAQEHWLGRRLRQVRWRRAPRYRGVQASAYVLAVDGIGAYVAGLVRGEEPSTALLDPMWDMGRSWPLDFPELSR